MTVMTFKKGIAAFCCVLGIGFLLVGTHLLWNTPMEHGWEGVVSIVAGLLLNAMFLVLWP